MCYFSNQKNIINWEKKKEQIIHDKFSGIFIKNDNNKEAVKMKKDNKCMKTSRDKNLN